MIQAGQVCPKILEVTICRPVFAFIVAVLTLQAHVGTNHIPDRRASPSDKLSHALMLFLVQTFHHNSITTCRPRPLPDI